MSITPDERNQLIENRFHLDLLDMKLVRHGNSGDVYCGPGFIRQADEGKLEFRIYDQVRKSSFETLGLSLGASIPDDRFYDLEALDMQGRTWRADRILPATNVTFRLDGCICKGTAWQFTCSEDASDAEGSDRLWMYLPSEFKLPTSAFTRFIQETPDSTSYRVELNLWEIKSDRFEFLLTKVDNGLELEVSIVKGPFPDYFDMRLEEAVWFVLAVPAKWSLLEQVVGGQRLFKIRPPRNSTILPRLRPPLEPDHGQQAIHSGEMFIRYLEYILPYNKLRYHPLSVAIYRNLRASALSLDSEALWIPVSIETVIEQCFKHLGQPEQAFLSNLDEAVEYVKMWTGDAVLKERMVKAIKGWRGQNSREALKQLTQKGVITEEQHEAWNRIRHRMAHGRQISNLLPELSELCDLTYMALLRLLFEVIGYRGLYTNRTKDGWRLAEYTPIDQSDGLHPS